ncbi:hypothetical protein V1502_10295 [Bacillus sp. SCS-153A]|uniref:hypothetical protein n=1 Tax=Rossellomorea sedimentorum TaxID=3115294 RepID=UPI003905B384
MQRKRLIIVLLVLLIMAAIITNPTRGDYIEFSEEKVGDSYPEETDEIYNERINFYLFSAYTPVLQGEHGISHLGIFGQFYQLSDGQFDYPWCLEQFS